MSEFYKSVLSELFQFETTQINIVTKILQSKRLLSDHIEIVEIGLNDINSRSTKPSQLFKLTHGSFLVAVAAITSHTSNLWRYALPIVSVGYISLHVLKTFNRIRNKFMVRRIEKLTSLFDQFEMVIKRNLIFFNENQMSKEDSSEVLGKSNMKKERESAFYQSIKSIANLLSSQLNEIEKLYPLPAKYDHIYEPLEDITKCEQLTKMPFPFTAKDAKLLYNIFAYVQSHFLMRLGLAAAYFSISPVIFYDFTVIRKELNANIDEHSKIFEKLTKPANKSDHEMTSVLIPTTGSNISTSLKMNSLIFSSKLMITAHECRNLDNDLQNILCRDSSKCRDSLLELLSRVKSVESNMSICHEEFNRFNLNLNKYIYDEYNIPTEVVVPTLTDSNDKDTSVLPNNTKTVNEKTTEDLDDDFFLVTGGAGDNPPADEDYDESLQNINNRLLKSSFRPVLSQLKTKIEPINAKVMSKEKEILAAKGIVLAEEIQSTLDADESDDFDEVFKLKKKNSQAKYDDSRDVLLSKIPFHSLPLGFLPIPMQSMGNEDVIGDETDE